MNGTEQYYLSRFLGNDFLDEFSEEYDPFGFLDEVFSDESSESIEPSDSSNIPPQKTRKEYGKGPEHQKLQKMPHFGQPYKHLLFYRWLGKPKKKRLIEIGRKYNDDFQQEILLKQLPKFTRDHSRRYDLAYFFLDDNKNIIIPWLTKIRMNSPDF